MKRVVVCGATGAQGGAFIQVCQQRTNWELIGFSRDLSQPRAQELTSLGVEMREADLCDLDSLLPVFAEGEAVFAVTQPWNRAYTRADPQSELEQGRNIVQACKATGIEHLVMCSALHMSKGETGLPHVDTKIEIEELVRRSDVPATILMPVQFMDNLGKKFLPVRRGRIVGFIHKNARVPYIATLDIGRFALHALENPDQMIGAELPLIGDYLSGLELASILQRIRRQRIRYTAVPSWLIWLYSREFYKMRRMFEKYGGGEYEEHVKAVIDECRRINPDLMSMEQYLVSTGWAHKEL